MFDARPQIDSLTPEQTMAITRWRDEWSAASWFTNKVDRVTTDNAVCKLYEAIGLEEPVIFWCQSPFQLITMPVLLRVILSSDVSAAPSADRGLDSHGRWALFSRAKTKERTKRARDPMVHLWANLNAQLDRHPRSQLAPELGQLIGDRFTNYLFTQTIPRLGQSTSVFSASVLQSIERHLKSDLRRSFEGFWRHLDFVPTIASAISTFAGGLDKQTKAKLTQLLRDDLSKTYAAIGQSDESSLAFINIDHVLRSWLTKHQKAWWGPQDLYWLAMYDFARNEIDPKIFDEQTTQMLDLWLSIARGGSAYLFLENYCFIASDRFNTWSMRICDCIAPTHRRLHFPITRVSMRFTES